MIEQRDRDKKQELYVDVADFMSCHQTALMSCL